MGYSYIHMYIYTYIHIYIYGYIWDWYMDTVYITLPLTYGIYVLYMRSMGLRYGIDIRIYNDITNQPLGYTMVIIHGI